MKNWIKWTLTVLALAFIVSGCAVFQTSKTEPHTTEGAQTEVTTEPTTEVAETEQEIPVDPYPTYRLPVPSDRERGNIISKVSYDPQKRYAIHYPAFGKEKVDGIIVQQIEDWIKEYTGESHPDSQSEMRIDYASYDIDNDRVTVLFYVEKNGSDMAHPDEMWQTRYFDIKKDEEIPQGQLIGEKGIKQIASLATSKFERDAKFADLPKDEMFEEGMAPTEANYRNTVITDDGVRIIFEKYQIFAGFVGTQIIEIPKSEIEELPVFAPPATEPATEAATEPETEAATEPVSEEATEAETEEAEETEPETSGDEKLIALTFDDGPTPGTTQRILDALDQVDGHATFFMLGNRINSYPDVVQAVSKQGSEIGNHSYSHPDLTKLYKADLDSQIQSTDEIIADQIGSAPKVMRPPYGAHDSDVAAAAGKPIILWSIDTLDWKTRDADSTVDTVLSQAEDGDIVLMHDLYEATADAAVRLIPELAQRGFKLVTVSQLIESRGVSFDAGKVITSVTK